MHKLIQPKAAQGTNIIPYFNRMRYNDIPLYIPLTSDAYMQR